MSNIYLVSGGRDGAGLILKSEWEAIERNKKLEICLG